MKSYSIYGTEKWETYFVEDVYKYLLNKNYDVSIYKKIDFCLDITNNHKNWYGELRKNIIFQLNETKQFFVINHADQSDDIPQNLINHSLCIGLLKCQYKPGIYDQFKNKVSPFTYGVKEKYNYFNNKIKSISNKNKKMYFKGNETGRKNILVKLAKMGIINDDYGIRDDKNTRNAKINQYEYLQNMLNSEIALSLPGIGNFCHREIEAFGIGVPVIMPELVNNYYNNLIPDIHYISINNSSIGKNIKKYTDEEINIFCNIIKNKYEIAINNKELLQKIKTNAMDWFNQNIVFPNNIKLMEEILLNKFNFIL